MFVATSMLRDSAAKLVEAGSLAAGAGAYVRAAATSPSVGGPGQSYYDAADAYAAAGMRDSAMVALDSAMRYRYHDSAGLLSDSVLTPLHATPRWRVIRDGVEENERRFRREHSDLDRVRISTADIASFWRAFDLAAREQSTDAKANVFLREYIAPGSEGLHDFYVKKIRSAPRLAKAVEQYPAFYASLRAATVQLSDVAPEIRTVFQRLHQLYPETIYPDVYFVVGAIRSAGTMADYGLLFGAEQNVGGPEVVVSELSEPLQRIVFARADLPRTIAHELVHFQQHLATKHTLLDDAEVEGGATFLADLLVSGRPAPYFMTWGAAHEREVWTRFAKEMNRDDVSNWIGNNDGTARADWPADLGYFVGYQICKAYYDQAANKRDAIRTLIALDDTESILRQSQYAERFK